MLVDGERLLSPGEKVQGWGDTAVSMDSACLIRPTHGGSFQGILKLSSHSLDMATQDLVNPRFLVATYPLPTQRPSMKYTTVHPRIRGCQLTAIFVNLLVSTLVIRWLLMFLMWD